MEVVEVMYVWCKKYSPTGEYIRLVIMERLYRGPASVEELDRLAEEAAKKVGVRYDWRIWPKLLEDEVVITEGKAHLTPAGKMVYVETKDAVQDYLKKVGINT